MARYGFVKTYLKNKKAAMRNSEIIDLIAKNWKMNQAALAYRLGVTRSVISRAKGNRTIPPILVRSCRIHLRLDIEALQAGKTLDEARIRTTTKQKLLQELAKEDWGMEIPSDVAIKIVRLKHPILLEKFVIETAINIIETLDEPTTSEDPTVHTLIAGSDSPIAGEELRPLVSIFPTGQMPVSKFKENPTIKVDVKGEIMRDGLLKTRLQVYKNASKTSICNVPQPQKVEVLADRVRLTYEICEQLTPGKFNFEFSLDGKVFQCRNKLSLYDTADSAAAQRWERTFEKIFAQLESFLDRPLSDRDRQKLLTFAESTLFGAQENGK